MKEANGHPDAKPHRSLNGSLKSTGAVTLATYRESQMYPRIVRAVDEILASGKVVTPVDILVAIGILDRKRIEDWRRGRTPYLERVIEGNLMRLSSLLRILRYHAHDLKLKPSWTAYLHRGKGPKQRLRFTRTGDPKIEEAYATHFVWPGRDPFYPSTSAGRGIGA